MGLGLRALFLRADMYTEETKERFEKYVNKDEKHQCWLWLGPKSGLGYGKLFHDNRYTLAHRAQIEITRKIKLNPSDFVLHKCDNKSCVNPDHLYIGGYKENSLDVCESGSNKHLNKKPRLMKIKIAHAKKMFSQGMTLDEVQVKTGIECNILRDIRDSIE